ncbi:alpha/beta hydrolase [Mycolicibacterium sp. Dal123E01]|uniref:alpha/beta hydrolase n=1 Tax=Mycolicibacterium sp. Dal123E01 TaxID=3457578 RepID=UPI00403E3B08
MIAVGRVGGLAVALGVGVAVLCGQGTASADSRGADSPATGSAHDGSTSAAHRGGSAGPKRPVSVANQASVIATNNASVAPASPVRRPQAPGDALLALGLVTARRETAGNPITIDPRLTIVDGIVKGDVGASDATGAALSYTLVGHPSAGGKLSMESALPAGEFSYLPDRSALTAGVNEQFTILVSQNTAFDKFVANLPVVGGFGAHAIVVLHQTPILGDLLAPIIGYSRIATFDSDQVLPAAGPVAFTYMMPSFDGTRISVNWFPASNLPPTGLATTVLYGPGLSSPGETDPYVVNGEGHPHPGIKELRDGGYNVVTWDPRGVGVSGGILQLDNPFYEGRDVSSMISWVAQQPNSVIDDTAAKDPRVGMIGRSYGAGIQPVAAGIDDRIDAIVPESGWNSLNDSLYPSGAFRTVAGLVLAGFLVSAGARINSQIYFGLAAGVLFGYLPNSAQAVLASSGPTALVSRILAPTLFVQGTFDVMFPLQEVVNSASQMAPGVPVHMIWYCGGHGVCMDKDTTGTRPLDATMTWLKTYVKREPTVAGPVFEYVDQRGVWYQSGALPSDAAFYGAAYHAVTGASGGVLGIVPVLGGSGPELKANPVFYGLGMASKADNAINVAVPTQSGDQYVGAPTVSFDYAGVGTNRFVYAQLVDKATGKVLGTQVTPVPVRMDGQKRTVTINLEDIVYTAEDADTDNLTLQITSSATTFENFTAFGMIDISNISLTLPTPKTITPELVA